MTLFISEPEIKVSDKPEHQWMIIDGALLPEAHQALPSLFTAKHKERRYQAVFEHTRWHDVADVGPLLIHYHPDIAAWAQQKRPWQFGIVFESAAPMKSIIQHWLTLSDCQQPGLEGSLCRLYDAVVFYHLLNQTEAGRLTDWLGPMEKIWLPDYVRQQYWYAEHPKGAATTSIEKTLFTDPEWQALSDAKRYATAHRLSQHVDDFFPHYWQENNSQENNDQEQNGQATVSPVDKHTHIQEHLALIGGLGNLTLQGATYYMNMVCRIGNVWDKNHWSQANDALPSPHQAIAELLEQQNAQPLTDRLETANQMALNYHIELNKTHELNSKEVTA